MHANSWFSLGSSLEKVKNGMCAAVSNNMPRAPQGEAWRMLKGLSFGIDGRKHRQSPWDFTPDLPILTCLTRGLNLCLRSAAIFYLYSAMLLQDFAGEGFRLLRRVRAFVPRRGFAFY